MANFKITQRYLEWCTELPSLDHPRESPVFKLNGNEWCFQFLLFRYSTGFYYDLYLKLINKHKDWKPSSVTYQIGFKNENVLSLGKGSFKTSESVYIWYSETLHSKLPSDYAKGNWIKFKFVFDEVVRPLLAITKNKGTQTEIIKESGDIHLDALSRDFSKLMVESSTCDVKITCEDKTFNAHRNVLEARSTVFSAMLQSNMTESESGLIHLKDIKASIFENFLLYLYSGRLPELNVESAKEFYEISDKYAVEELKKSCSEYLTKNLSEDNACEILILADQHSDRDFREYVISYIIKKKIPEMDDSWLDFSEIYPRLSAEILNLYVRGNRSD